MAEITLKLQPKQKLAFESPATEILYGGQAGGGKSHLIRVAAIVWATRIPGLQIYIFRREYNDLIANHLDGPTGLRMMLAPWVEAKLCKINTSNFEIRFLFNNSIIRLRHLQRDTDVYGYWGQEINVLCLDETTHFPEWVYRYLRGRVRLAGVTLPPEYEGKFPRILCGTNPGSLGHSWVKQAWVDSAPPYAIWQTGDEEGGFKRQFIPASLEDNQILLQTDPNYAQRLMALGDPALVAAMLHGDWDIVSGGALDDVWKTQHVVLQPFEIPKTWYINRAYDWGESKPWACCWFAEANGEEVTLADGTQWAPYPGSIFVIDEHYGWTGKADEGSRMTIAEQAMVIKDKDKEWKEKGYHVLPGPADNAIWDVRNNTKSFAAEFADYGVHWTRSDKSPGSRVTGLATMRRMLKATQNSPMEMAGLFVFDTCRQVIRTLPVLPRSKTNPDDVDTNAEDHCYDLIRYRVSCKNQQLTYAKVSGF